MSEIEKIAKKVYKESGLKTIKIREKTYTIKLLPSTVALAVAVDLFGVFLPSICSYFDGMNKKEAILPEEDSMWTEVSLLLVRQMKDISVVSLVRTLTEEVYYEGEKIDIDVEFKGNLGGLIALVEIVIRENCGDFFAEWLMAKGISLPSPKNLMTVEPDSTTKE